MGTSDHQRFCFVIFLIILYYFYSKFILNSFLKLFLLPYCVKEVNVLQRIFVVFLYEGIVQHLMCACVRDNSKSCERIWIKMSRV